MQLQLFLSDNEAAFSKSIGWTISDRTARYAIVIDHGKVTYAEKEPGKDVSVSWMEVAALVLKTGYTDIPIGLRRPGSPC